MSRTIKFFGALVASFILLQILNTGVLAQSPREYNSTSDRSNSTCVVPEDVSVVPEDFAVAFSSGFKGIQVIAATPEYVVYAVSNSDGTVTINWWGLWPTKCEPSLVNEEEDVIWEGDTFRIDFIMRLDNQCSDAEPEGSDWYAYSYTTEVLEFGTSIVVVLWQDVAPPEDLSPEFVFYTEHYFTAGISGYPVMLFLPVVIR